jgi:hypothetical protein
MSVCFYALNFGQFSRNNKIFQNNLNLDDTHFLEFQAKLHQLSRTKNVLLKMNTINVGT